MPDQNATEILVAEDSPTQAVEIRILLESAGYSVQVVGDGKQAVERVRQQQPDVVVTDLQMPELNGLEVVEMLHLEFPKLPVVLTTSQGSESIAAQALHKGAASYVPKKLITTDLIPTLEQIACVIAANRNETRLDQLICSSETVYLLTNDLSLIAALNARLQEELKRLELCDEGEVMQIAMALDESLTNAVIHGNLEVSSKLREIDGGAAYVKAIEQRKTESPYCDRRVRVAVRLSRDCIEYSIRDEGPGFDVASLPDPTDENNLDNLSGRGLLLMNAFMDEVQHNEKGNEITLRKRLPIMQDD